MKQDTEPKYSNVKECIQDGHEWNQTRVLSYTLSKMLSMYPDT
jgi:hypothetical protein